MDSIATAIFLGILMVCVTMCELQEMKDNNAIELKKLEIQKGLVK